MKEERKTRKETMNQRKTIKKYEDRQTDIQTD